MKANLSETELEVLKVLWDRGPSTVREAADVLAAQGRRWAYTTVLTLLNRLEAKGYVGSDKTEVAHVFTALVSRDQLLDAQLARLATDLCDGTRLPLVQALVEGGRFSAEEIEHFRRLIDQLQPKPSRRKRRGG